MKNYKLCEEPLPDSTESDTTQVPQQDPPERPTDDAPTPP